MSIIQSVIDNDSIIMKIMPLLISSYGSSGSSWIIVGQRGSAWVSVGQRGSAWVSVGQRGSAWVSVGQRGSAWVILYDCCGYES